MKSRLEMLADIESASAFDLCIIGGGASGAGCALDAQLRGLRTVLVDAGDFGSATSSASTKLIHGGLRYLQQAFRDLDLAQYRVVRLALRERGVMIRNAPFLTRVCEFVVPCEGLRDRLYFEVGLKLYDWISGIERLRPSRFAARAEILADMTWLKNDRLSGAVLYSDGQFDDARYNLALVQTCVEHGGKALNYASVKGFEKNDRGEITTANVEDKQSGTSFKIPARCFVNATGPFADSLRRLANDKVEERLTLSRGIHILLPLKNGFRDGGNALVIPETEDGRLIFAIPWLGRLLVGTTDTPYDGSDMVVTRAEAEYVLRHLNRHLAVPYATSDIVSAIVGLRPLVKAKTARQTKRLVRDYEIELDGYSGLISILGGKWSVYRAMAEDAVNAVEEKISRRLTESRTRSHKLFGSHQDTDNLIVELHESYRITAATARHLVEKFGWNARRVLDLTRRDPSLLSTLADGAPQLIAEIVYCARQEMAVSVEDVLSRRLGLEIFDWLAAIKAAPVVGDVLGRELEWSPSRTKEEVDRYVRKIARSLREIGLSSLQEEVASHP